MKELSIEEKAKAYDKAIEKAKNWYIDAQIDFKKSLETLFPSLKENENEKIRKELIKFVKVNIPDEERYITWLEKQKERGPLSKDEEYTLARIIEYLEDNDCPSKWKDLLHDVYALPYQKEQKEDVTRDKIAEYLKKLILDQSQRGAHMLDYEGRIEEEVDFIISIAKKELKKVEQKSAYKVKPKFKVGDWCIDNEDGIIFQIVKVLDNTYTYKTNEGKEYSCTHYSLENDVRLWTIQDAKSGDVLACNEEILLFKSYSVQGRISLYCWYNGQTNNFHSKEVDNTLLTTRNKICPAAKEQRNLLFQKMKEAGYEYDTKKKELKKIVDEEQIKKNLQDNSFRRMFEQKPADKVEPKFHQGEWITNGDYTWKIIEVKPLDYILQSQDGNIVDDTISHVDEQFHSFTIEDAKDGDVLTAHECIVLFKEIDGLNIKCHCTYHFMNNPNFYVNTLQNKSAFHPATKEQRTSLFQKIKEAGYEWNTEELKLETIEQKYDVSDNDSEKRSVQGDDRDKELSLSLQIQAYLNTASDELYASGKPLCSEKHIKDIHKCMLMWKKLHDSYFNRIYTWSEEDETYLEHCITAVKNYYTDDKGEENPFREPILDFLKSLKERHAWKKSLATADLENSLCDIQDGYSDTSYEYRILGEAIEFIRCTEPQSHWKPSKEQITELHRVISGCSYDIEPLVEIEKHLKKLMEE